MATQLFGQRGFDGVTTREIAACAGLNVATVAHHVGSKAELYDAVLQHLHAHEAQMLDVALSGVTPELLADPMRVRALLRGLADAYVDVLRVEPEIAGLWTRRWIEPRPQGDAEARLARPLLARLEQLLHDAQRSGSLPPMDAHLAVKSVVWVTYGYFTGGLLEDRTTDPGDPAQLQRLRDVLARLLDGLWGQP